LLEQEPQFLQRFMMSPEHQAAGCVAVEPVCERRQSETQRVEIVLEAQAALRPRVDGDARRLVENEHHPVAIKEPRTCFFRRHGDSGIPTRRRPHRGGAARVSALDDDKKAKSGLLRRWFGGADAATAPPSEKSPAPGASEAEPPAADPASQNV